MQKKSLETFLYSVGGVIAMALILVAVNVILSGARQRVDLTQEKSHMFKVESSVTLDEIVAAVNRVGMAPGDLMAILEALKQAGALRAELIVI